MSMRADKNRMKCSGSIDDCHELVDVVIHLTLDLTDPHLMDFILKRPPNLTTQILHNGHSIYHWVTFPV